MFFNLRQNQKGIATPTIIVLLIIVLATAGGAYWFVSKSSDKKASNSSQSSNSAKTCKDSGGDDDFCQFVSNAQSLSTTPYIAEMTTNKDGQTTVVKIKSDGKGNSHIEGDQTSIISLNGNNYIQNGEVWFKYPKNEDNNASTQDISLRIEDLGLSSNEDLTDKFKKVGEEACGDKNCLKYEIYTDKEGTTQTTTVWIDDIDFRPQKIESKDETNGSLTIVFSYDDVVISEPSPVQELNPSTFTPQ